jgi:single-stranded DNA-binding protein
MLNRIQLIGHLGADPETRYFPNGERYVNLSSG